MSENIETLSRTIGWANHLLTWAWVLWFGIGTVVGGIMLARDEWRLHRTRPRPEEVSAYADDLIARHGRDAFCINGDAMIAARAAKEFDRYRFLKEVSGELVHRLFGPTPSNDLPSAGSHERCERPENARCLVRVDPVLNNTRNTKAASRRPCVTHLNHS